MVVRRLSLDVELMVPLGSRSTISTFFHEILAGSGSITPHGRKIEFHFGLFGSQRGMTGRPAIDPTWRSSLLEADPRRAVCVLRDRLRPLVASCQLPGQRQWSARQLAQRPPDLARGSPSRSDLERVLMASIVVENNVEICTDAIIAHYL